MKLILNLEEWNLTADALPGLGPNESARVHLMLPHPSYQSVIAYPPAERRKRISAQLRLSFDLLRKLLHGRQIEKMGTHSHPTGAKAVVPLNQLPALLANQAVGYISVEAIEGHDRKRPAPQKCFWSIKARFAIQIENKKSGLQTYEDRILLVQALDVEDAHRKLLPSFEHYAEPYLNAAGLLVRWQFEEFLDAYATEASSLQAFLHPEGVEVFSALGAER